MDTSRELAGARSLRLDAGVWSAVALLIVYAATLAPDVTFWDAGEFIAAARSLGIPHPPGTPLYVLLLNTWTRLVPLPFAVATNLASAVATAAAVGLLARLIQRVTGSLSFALAAALVAGGMSSVWLNATETEVYAASLLLGALMISAGERAGRDEPSRIANRKWVYLTAYFIALAVPLHLSALVAAPAAIALATQTPTGIHWRRAALLTGVLIVAIGVGRTSAWIAGVGVVLTVAAWWRPGLATIGIVGVAVSALGFLYVRARFDPAINQGGSETWQGLIDLVGRRQYNVHPLWPRTAPLWVQTGNLGQYADWQAALSLGPTVLPSVGRSVFTVAFLILGYQGAVHHWHRDRRTWIGLMALLVGGSLGVLAYLNLAAGPSIGYGILPNDVTREARERDYFYVFAFLTWGLWAGVGAVSLARRFGRPAWAGVVVAAVPIVLNWRAVTRRHDPERSVPRLLAVSILESTPRNGVLFAMGDNDSYPLWFAQEVESVRTDVAVVTVPLLPTEWYRDQIMRRFALLDSASAGRYETSIQTAARIADAARAQGRPVAATMTMTPAERGRLRADWTASGMVYVEGGKGGELLVDTIASMRAAERIEAALPRGDVRDAIDPVHRYFRQMLDCPRSLAESARTGDFTRLDSTCSYR